MFSITPVGTHFIPGIRKLAFEIWPVSYRTILSEEQLGYMLELFYSETALRNQMEQKHHQFVMAFEGETPVGFASYAASEENASHFHLHKIYVLPECHGKGYGKKLIQYIRGEIEKQEACCLTLNVNKHNPALEFYQHLGFRIRESVIIEIGNGYVMDDYILELSPIT